MSTPAKEPQEAFVYRRVHPSQFNSKTQKIRPQVFALRPNEDGLSVFDASAVTARDALQAFIDDNTARSGAEDEIVRQRAQKMLEDYPDVETMVTKGWRIIQIPVAEILARGFHLTATEANGHLEIRGEPERFKERELDFAELVAEGIAPLLNDADCLEMQ